MAAKKIRNNTDLIKDLMEFSPYGALSQMFIIEALHRYVKEVNDYEVTEKDQRGLIDMNAWKGCAKDIEKRMDEFYNRHK